MNCVIVDDDRMAREVLLQMVNEHKALTLLASFDSPLEAFRYLGENPEVDLLFLDIEMPLMSGLEMASSLKKQPFIIFTTGNKEYAVSAFEHNVVDYLVKPIQFPRFLKACEKAKEMMGKGQPAGEPDAGKDYLFVKSSGLFIRLKYDEISLVEAVGDYVSVRTSGKKYVIHDTMKKFQERLPGNFVRTHRSFIVNADKITSVEDSTISVGGELVPIGVSFRESVYKRLKLT